MMRKHKLLNNFMELVAVCTGMTMVGWPIACQVAYIIGQPYLAVPYFLILTGIAIYSDAVRREPKD